MALTQNYHAQGGQPHGDYRAFYDRSHGRSNSTAVTTSRSYNDPYFIQTAYYNYCQDIAANIKECGYRYGSYAMPEDMHSSKRRKFSASACGDNAQLHQQPNGYDNDSSRLNTYDNITARNHSAYAVAPTKVINSCSVNAMNVIFPASDNSTSSKRDRSEFEGDDNTFFMSRDEIERCSPSRKDGIDAMQEANLRYSYCAFLQNLGLRLELPHTTIGTAMVLCHRFFVRRSHANHDRFLVATAALFLSAKSEETPRPLNNILNVSCEILHKQDSMLLSYILPVGWFEQYREKVIEAEQLILTTLNFELNVQHPYAPLTSTLEKLGFAQPILVEMALEFVSQGVYRRISMLACMIFLAGGPYAVHQMFCF